MKERIQRILQDKHLTSAKLADMIQVQRSSISHILSGRNKPSMDFMEKILTNFPEISGDWLITGEGAMYKEGANMTESAHQKPSDNPSTYKNSLFEAEDDSPIKRINQGLVDRGLHEQFPTPKPARIVKRVVIYYDDNSYDELFLNK